MKPLSIQLYLLHCWWIYQCQRMRHAAIRAHFEAGMWLAHALLTLSEQLFHFGRPPGRIRYHIAYWLLDLSTAVANSFGRRCGLLK